MIASKKKRSRVNRSRDKAAIFVFGIEAAVCHKWWPFWIVYASRVFAVFDVLLWVESRVIKFSGLLVIQSRFRCLYALHD